MENDSVVEDIGGNVIPPLKVNKKKKKGKIYVVEASSDSEDDTSKLDKIVKSLKLQKAESH